MRAAVSLVAAVLVSSATLFAARAAAQETEMERAEAAYLDVDFEGTRTHALEALREGGHSPQELVRIYSLLGISSSALGDEDAARDYFVRMLGLDANATLDDSVPPRLRNPFLEARGQWSARQGRLEVETGLDRASSAVRVELRDPTGMARVLRVAARLEGTAEYTVQEYQSQTVLAAPLAGAADADRVEYYVEVLDMHNNVILAEGSAFAPHVLGRAPTGGGGDGGGGGPTIFEEPIFWIIVGAVALAGALVGTIIAIDAQSHLGVQSGVSFGID